MILAIFVSRRWQSPKVTSTSDRPSICIALAISGVGSGKVRHSYLILLNSAILAAGLRRNRGHPNPFYVRSESCEYQFRFQSLEF